jgi:hypothetical protein
MVNISCMGSVIASETGMGGYYDHIICKWVLNDGTDYYDNNTQANADCLKVGYSSGLWTGHILELYGSDHYSSSDKAMLLEYIKSSSYCDR